MSPLRDFEGKVALIVGGSRNRGAMFAESLASRGATTVISYAHDDLAAERTLALLEKYEVTAEASRSDATVSADVNTLFKGIMARHGRLDVVIHVPGVVAGGLLADLTDDDFDLLIDRNTRGVFNTLRAAARHLADGGRYVVLLAAPAWSPTGHYGLYSGARAAIEHLVAAAAMELRDRGITVNAVTPDPEDAPSPQPSRVRNLPRDITSLVSWLISDEAGWVTGQTLRAGSAV
ncbi:SDR family oxidoreductase [Streptosporangium sp. CA-135522]|uniref:SDR family oxidoreductase n=1 Tax=Streptosporangium sp. CA-135522 TaxID=3240072 RepID=UPI003D8ACD06